MQQEVEKIIVDLLKSYLSLPDDYGTDDHGNVIPTVVIRGQNVKLFNTPHVQITVSTIASNTFANRREQFERTITVDNQPVVQYCERVCLNEQKQMQIDIYSRNNEARQRYWEVQAALNSTYSQQLQDQYQFRISKMSNSFNTTGLEGGSDINRYSIRFNCLTWQEKITPIEYYDSFRTQARTDNTHFAASFTIDTDGIHNVTPYMQYEHDYFAFVNYQNIIDEQYEQWQGGFSNYENFDTVGGFATYDTVKNSYK